MLICYYIQLNTKTNIFHYLKRSCPRKQDEARAPDSANCDNIMELN